MNVPGSKLLLGSHYLFRNLETEQIERIAALSVTRPFDAGQAIFVKGEPGDALFGVLEGQVKISTSSVDGREMILNILEQGEIFGEIALLDGHDRTADATAVKKTRLLQIRRRDFLPMLERDPDFAIYFIQILCRRLRWTSELIEDSAFLPLPSRLAKRLLTFSYLQNPETKSGETGSLKLSQTELGQMMSVSREAINRHLQGWAQAGLIKLGRGRIDIVDQAGLKEIATADDFF